MKRLPGMDREIDADAVAANAQRIWTEFQALVGKLPAAVRRDFLLRLLSDAREAGISHWIDQRTGGFQGTVDQAPRDFRAMEQASRNDGDRS